MEGTHGQLRARLADGLGGHNTNRVANLDHASGTHVPAITVLADAVSSLTRQRRAQIQLRYLARRGDRVAHLLVDGDVALGDDLTGRLVYDIPGQDATWQLRQPQLAPGWLDQVIDPDPELGTAIVLVDDHVLGNVDQTASQVARVGRTNGRIRQTLACAVRREEVLEHGQPVAE